MCGEERDLRSAEFPRNLWRRRGARYRVARAMQMARGNFCRVQLSARRFGFCTRKKSTLFPSFFRILSSNFSIFSLFFFSLFQSPSTFIRCSVIFTILAMLFSWKGKERACFERMLTKFPRRAIFAYTLRTYFKRYSPTVSPSLLLFFTILEQTSVSPHFFLLLSSR